MKREQLNILQVITGSGWSGGQQQTLHLLEGLRERGHNVFLACPPENVMGGRAEESGIPVTRIHMERERDFRAMYRLYRLMKREKIDVVNTQNATAHTLALAAARFSGVPAFVATRRVSVRIKRRISARFKYSAADRIIAVSEAVKDVLIKSGVRPDIIVTVYSGSDLGRFTPGLDGGPIRDELGIPRDVPLIGMVGNVAEEKGQSRFVKAAGLVIRKLPDARFILVGRGADGNFVKSLDGDMVPYFTCTGFREDVPSILAAMDVHVNSAIGFDGLAGTIREGMAMGVPTVATDVAGHREIVKPMETGLLVPPDDEEALASAIVRLVNDRRLASEMARKGMAFVRENLSKEAMVDRTEAVYQDILKEKGLL